MYVSKSVSICASERMANIGVNGHSAWSIDISTSKFQVNCTWYSVCASACASVCVCVWAPNLKLHPKIIDVNVISVRFYVIRPHFLPEHSGTSSLIWLSCMELCLAKIQSKSRTMRRLKTLISWNWFVLNEIDSCGNLMISNAVYQIQCHRCSFSLFCFISLTPFSFVQSLVWFFVAFSIYTHIQQSIPMLNDTNDINVDRM